MPWIKNPFRVLGLTIWDSKMLVWSNVYHFPTLRSHGNSNVDWCSIAKFLNFSPLTYVYKFSLNLGRNAHWSHNPQIRQMLLLSLPTSQSAFPGAQYRTDSHNFAGQLSSSCSWMKSYRVTYVYINGWWSNHLIESIAWLKNTNELICGQLGGFSEPGNRHVSSDQNPPVTFHYTPWLIGIVRLIMIPIFHWVV